MADNVAQSIKDLQKDLAALDKQLLSNNANWNKLGQTIVDSLKRGGLGLDDLFSKMKGQKDVLKLKAIIDRDALMDDVKKLQTAVDKGFKSIKIGGVEITGQRQIEQALDGYKAQLKLVPKTLAEAYDYAVKIANTLGGTKTPGTLLGKARADEMTKVQKYTKLANEELARQQRIEDTIAKIRERKGKSAKFDGEVKSIQQLNDMLTISKRQLDEYIRTLNSLGSRGRSAASGFGGDGTKTALKNQEANFIKLNKLLNQRREILSRMGKGGTDAQKAEYKALNAEIRNTIGNMRELESKYNGITNKARQNTLYQRLHTTNQSISRLNGSLTKTKSSLESMLPTLRRLASAFGVAFSVQGLVNFGRKLVETRGEFEMQFVAIRQIIGDADAATKIWNQTMQQALQSPFKAMQLVDYTKKLAAYRIETDKLFDTTKRLADVSAGLGVDMGRLILAYGQVKAANFLRASEIRQFTEAGVNIVGQLSEYFTQLEGRAVSTADVMERVTKRMVLFEDVEEIFKRMTDEGGTFYNMQEVQADTVRGQIMKLHDAYDQMLNTIGQANQGTIRNLIESANSLVRNWRDVASFLMKNVNAFVILLPLIATYRNGAKLAAGETFTWTRAMRQIGLELTFARNGMKKFSISTAAGTAAVYMFKGAMEILKTTFRTFVPFLAIEGLMLLVTKMQAADRAAKQLTKDLDEVGKRNAQSLQDNIDGFTNLVERLKRATEGSQDYLDIRNKIQSQYGEYLDNLEAEQITVENLANSYDRVVERMREKSRQHIMEEGLQEIDKAYSDAYLKFTKALEGVKVGNIKLSSGEAGDIAKKMYDLYSKKPSGYDANKLFLDALKKYGLSGRIDGTTFSERNEFFKSIEQRYKKQLELETKANSLTKATSDTRQEYLDQLAVQEEHEREIAKIESKTALSTEKKNYLIHAEDLRYQEKKLELLAKYGKKSDEWLDNEKKKLKENYDAFLNSYNARVEAYIGSVYGQNWRENDNEKAFKDYNAMVATQSRIAQGQSRWEESILNDKKVTEENIKRLKEEQATQTAKDAEATKYLNDELAKENHRLAIIKKQMELLGLHEKDKSKGGVSANNSIYGDRIRLLQDMLQKYRQAAKEAYGFAKAEEKTGQSFEDAWDSIMPSGYGGLEVPTSYSALAEMLQRLEAFTPQFDKNGQLSKMMADLKKAIADALSNVDLEMFVRIREDFGRQMEEAFGNYELTLELQKLNLPSDVAENMFGIEPVTLDQIRQKIGDWYDSMRKDGYSLISQDDYKEVEKYLKKVDDLERKQQRERIKDYAKYLEYEMSERAKIAMDYTRKIAEVQAETAFKPEQRERIIGGLKKEMGEKLAQQDWEDFKGTEVYVQMMEDLEKHGTDALVTMRRELEKVRENAENLSPRALKEVVNAIEKIKEIELNRSTPFVNVAEARKEFHKSMRDAGVSSAKELFQQADALEKQRVELSRQKMELEGIVGAQREYYDATKKLDNINNQSWAQRYLNAEDTDEAILDDYETAIANRKANDEELANLAIQRASADEASTKVIDEQVQSIQTETNAISIQIERLKEWIRLRGIVYGIDPSVLKNRNAESDLTEVTTQLEGVEGSQNKVNKAVNAYDNLGKSIKKTIDFVKNLANTVNPLFDNIMDNLDYLGGETNTLTAGWKEFGDAMISSITDISSALEQIQIVQDEIAKGGLVNSLMSGNLIAVAVAVLGVIIKVVSAIGKLHDARLDREIEIQQERIDALTDAYARLEKQIERTWSSVSYMQTYEQQVQNIREQIDAMEAQMRAEEAKKNTDDNAVRQYQRDIQEAYDQLDELEQKSIEVFGGIGEEGYRSAAEGFVDAWKSAFLETGDGLQGLQDHFDEFLQDWFVKQATMRIAGGMLEPVFRQIDAAVDKYGEGDTSAMLSEIQRVRDMAAAIFPDLSLALEDLAGMFGVGGEGSLSGLAAGIQGMTEEQANILEAYWNSVRMYTASIDMNVSRIAEMLGVGGPTSNPMLTQLQTIATNTGYIPRIYAMLDSTRRNLGNGQGFVTYNQ